MGEAAEVKLARESFLLSRPYKEASPLFGREATRSRGME